MSTLTESKIYPLSQYVNISFDGFEFTVPDETMALITKLANEVGSPTYIKTPVFHTRTSNHGSAGIGNGSASNRKKQNTSKYGPAGGVDEDWETIRSFQVTKMQKKEGIDGLFDKIRMQLNKITDKNYQEFRDIIIGLFDQLLQMEASIDDIMRVGNAFFDIASNNRFYSKLYADLYSDLIKKYNIMGEVFRQSFMSFGDLFKSVECGDPDKDYDEFCRINKVNECRRALSLFFVNLSKNGTLASTQLYNTLYVLVSQLFALIQLPNKQNEVNELSEIIAIIYSNELVKSVAKECSVSPDTANNPLDLRVDDKTIAQVIETIATSKPKIYPSLSNKAKFKFMDIRDAIAL